MKTFSFTVLEVKVSSRGFSCPTYHNSAHCTYKEEIQRFFYSDQEFIPTLHSGSEKIFLGWVCGSIGPFVR